MKGNSHGEAPWWWEDLPKLGRRAGIIVMVSATYMPSKTYSSMMHSISG